MWLLYYPVGCGYSGYNMKKGGSQHPCWLYEKEVIENTISVIRKEYGDFIDKM